MKILLLNPHIDAEHDIAQALQKRGVALLFTSNSDDCWRTLRLHGTSIDLAIVHREGVGADNGDASMKFIEKVKADRIQSDLPIILTSNVWGDAEFSAHQSGPHGVNAYLHAPFSDVQLSEMIEAVIGQPIGQPIQKPTGLVLEDAATLFARPETSGQSSGSIQLEAPELSKHEFAPIDDSREFVNPALDLGGGSFSPSILDSTSTNSVASVAAPLKPIEISEFEQIQSEPEFSQSPPPRHLSSSEAPSTSLEIQLTQHQAQTLPRTEFEPEPVFESDPQAEAELPYLFGKSKAPSMDPFAQPIGDAIVPGGAAQAPDTETLKKYLLLREQDVSVLSAQLKNAQDQINSLTVSLRDERSKALEVIARRS